MFKVLVFQEQDIDPISRDLLKSRTNIKNITFDFTLENPTVENLQMAQGYDAISIIGVGEFGENQAKKLSDLGINLLLVRSAGYDGVNIDALKKYNINAFNIPSYSPESIAEFAFSLLMAVNRNVNTAIKRTQNSNYSLKGLLGETIFGKTIGVVGAGKIGQKFINIANGFGAKVIVYDDFLKQNDKNLEIAKKFNFEYVDFDTLLKESNFISIHAFMSPQSHHMFNKEAFDKCKDSLVLVNCARGGFVDTDALIDALNESKIRGAGLDVYEHEAGKFFKDMSDQPEKDRTLAVLQNHKKVILTAHMAFATDQALENMLDQVVQNIEDFKNKKDSLAKIC